MDFLAGGEGEYSLALRLEFLKMSCHTDDHVLIRYINITKDGDPYLTLQLILGYICYPIAFLLGVPREDLLRVGELIGVKVIANEFVAYNSLTKDPQYVGMSPRSRLIATYALCGEFLSIKDAFLFSSFAILIMNISQASATLVLSVPKSVCYLKSHPQDLAMSPALLYPLSSPEFSPH